MTPPRPHRTALPEGVSAPVRTFVRRKLLQWYDLHPRDLPWRRRAGDPYAQWVAEIMLQQTRVETVIAYYESFLARFPNVTALARANHEKVLKQWEGLGYYRRALHLHEAARVLHRQGDGFPTTAEDLRRLPGIGDYTAAAIASIAFQEPAAAVDGNVARVIARLFGLTDNILALSGKRRVHEIAGYLMARKRCGDFNQAWMDLGRTICTPKAPRCRECPLAPRCAAAATNRAHLLPLRGTKDRRPVVHLVTVIFVHGDWMLVRRRPTGGLWSGLWEFPTVELPECADGNPPPRTTPLFPPLSRGDKRVASDIPLSPRGDEREASDIPLSPRGDKRKASDIPPLPREYKRGVRIQKVGEGPIRHGRNVIALVRRLADDLRVPVDNEPQSAGIVRHELTHRSVRFHTYVVHPVSRQPAVSRNTRWVTPRGLARLSVSTAHRRIYEKFRKACLPGG